jgi:hypothetical protein
MNVDIYDVVQAKVFLKKINEQKLDKIKWNYYGKPVFFKKKHIEEFKMMGLNNSDFCCIYDFEED